MNRLAERLAFRRAWLDCYNAGQCDEPMGAEWTRVLREWEMAGGPRPIREFIETAANYPIKEWVEACPN